MRERAHGEQGTRKAGALEITPFQPALLNSSTSQGRRGSKGTRNTLKQELKLTAAHSAAKSLSPDSGTILQQASPIRPTSTVTTRDTRILPRPELVKRMGCTRRACPPKPSARASVSLGVEAACSLTGERAHTHTCASTPNPDRLLVSPLPPPCRHSNSDVGSSLSGSPQAPGQRKCASFLSGHPS